MRTMNDEVQYLTAKKVTELTNELEELKTDKRKEVAEQLEYARSLGDLSENAEYQEAREAQGLLEARIKSIENILANAQVVDAGSAGGAVTIGSTVTIVKTGEKEERVYEVVGSAEADMKLRKISHTSPLGMAMMGKKKGQSFEFETPNGVVKYKIVKVD